MEETTTQACFRLPPDLLNEIDQHAAKVAKSTGMRVTRTDALRMLLRSALKQEKKK